MHSPKAGMSSQPLKTLPLKIMKVTVFGIGYVGLTQGAVLAEVGHDVVCVDVDADKVEKLKQGEIPIYEPGLRNLVKENQTAGRLDFTRSEEHTSELQSLMRISYAVFCLKKKK